MKGKEIYIYTLGGFVVGAIIGVTVLLIIVPVPEGNKDTVNIVIGALVTAAITVVGYFFGSSKSSSDKNELLANQKQSEKS